MCLCVTTDKRLHHHPYFEVMTTIGQSTEASTPHHHHAHSLCDVPSSKRKISCMSSIILKYTYTRSSYGPFPSVSQHCIKANFTIRITYPVFVVALILWTSSTAETHSSQQTLAGPPMRIFVYHGLFSGLCYSGR